MATADVTVHGAGIFGLSIAWACVKRGARVRVIDPLGPGGGTSGGVVGALAPHVPERWNEKKAFQFESLIMAESFWREIDGLSGMSSGYDRKGRLQPIADENALNLARTRTAGAAKLWQGKADWRICPVESFPHWAPESPTGQVIYDTLTARIHPRQACASLARALVKQGAEVVHDGPSQGLAIWATGTAGLHELSAQLEKPVGNGVKGQAALIAFDARDMPQLFADSVHIVPHADGTTAIGSTSERDFDAPDTTDDLLEDVMARAFSVCPAMAELRVLERWAGVRPRARSRAPMLGAYPGRLGQFIANGGFKIGFGMAPKVGEVMADLVLDGNDTIPPGFRVEDNL